MTDRKPSDEGGWVETTWASLMGPNGVQDGVHLWAWSETKSELEGSYKGISECLTDLGSEGWELVTTVFKTALAISMGSTQGGGQVFYLKRPRAPQASESSPQR